VFIHIDPRTSYKIMQGIGQYDGGIESEGSHSLSADYLEAREQLSLDFDRLVLLSTEVNTW